MNSQWASFHNFSRKTIDEIKMYFFYKTSRTFFEEKVLLDALSDTLKRKVVQHMHGPIIEAIPLFSDCSKAFIIELLLQLDTDFVSPYSIVVQEGPKYTFIHCFHVFCAIV